MKNYYDELTPFDLEDYARIVFNCRRIHFEKVTNEKHIFKEINPTVEKNCIRVDFILGRDGNEIVRSHIYLTNFEAIDRNMDYDKYATKIWRQYLSQRYGFKYDENLTNYIKQVYEDRIKYAEDMYEDEFMHRPGMLTKIDFDSKNGKGLN